MEKRYTHDEFVKLFNDNLNLVRNNKIEKNLVRSESIDSMIKQACKQRKVSDLIWIALNLRVNEKQKDTIENLVIASKNSEAIFNYASRMVLRDKTKLEEAITQLKSPEDARYCFYYYQYVNYCRKEIFQEYFKSLGYDKMPTREVIDAKAKEYRDANRMKKISTVLVNGGVTREVVNTK